MYIVFYFVFLSALLQSLRSSVRFSEKLLQKRISSNVDDTCSEAGGHLSLLRPITFVCCNDVISDIFQFKCCGGDKAIADYENVADALQVCEFEYLTVVSRP